MVPKLFLVMLLININGSHEVGISNKSLVEQIRELTKLFLQLFPVLYTRVITCSTISLSYVRMKQTKLFNMTMESKINPL